MGFREELEKIYNRDNDQGEVKEEEEFYLGFDDSDDHDDLDEDDEDFEPHEWGNDDPYTDEPGDYNLETQVIVDATIANQLDHEDLPF